MNPTIQDRLKDLLALCKERSVQRLALFGSAADGPFDSATSDLDLIVEFKPMPPAEHADSYFGLMEDLEKLFGMSIDLVEPGPIANPFFKQVVEETQVVLYEAA